MKKNHYSRKKRQLKNLSEKFRFLVENKNSQNHSLIKSLATKINWLIKEIKSFISISFLKKSLGTVAFGILFSNYTSAQSFNGPTQNPFGLTPAYYMAIPTAVDLDNDGDLDLLVGEYYGTLQYYQNIGSATSPNFWSPQQNPFGLQSGYYFAFPTFCDLDNDGDYDLLVGEYYGNFKYFTNTGTASAPAFAAPVLNPFGLTSAGQIATPNFVDLDNDGDFDILFGDYYGVISYFPNIGTVNAPNFGPKQSNPFGLTNTQYYSFTSVGDIDSDGDFDLLVGDDYGNLIFYENIGTANSPNFTSPLTNPFGIQIAYDLGFPCLADMDNDGDLDLFVGEYYGNFQYYEQVEPSAIDDNEFQFSLNVFPNPTTDYISIDSDEKIISSRLFDITGKEIPIELINHKISLNELASGYYTLKIINSNHEIAVTKIQKL